ncbi:unnamed protein product [Musa acuminata subsp. malaccensis]|uniref:(wild Malaysian banana) hypothetical protein n=1 Tax=Musa acuminata subsp. malaccensis TaxID=214687 RepID=A0A804J3H6_MUSAM|nr:unnamed protein product [Musa acuminata subsp. malaccensis]
MTYWTAYSDATRGSSPGVSCPRPQRGSRKMLMLGLDGGAEEGGADLRAGLAAAVPAGVRQRGQGDGTPVEPAQPRGNNVEGLSRDLHHHNIQ